jgi:hypothetical protein
MKQATTFIFGYYDYILSKITLTSIKKCRNLTYKKIENEEKSFIEQHIEF